MTFAMKTKLILFAAVMAALFCGCCPAAEIVRANAGDLVFLRSDDIRIYDKDLNRVVVRTAERTHSPKDYFNLRSVTLDESKDVVKALEILSKHVPTEYEDGVSGNMIAWGSSGISFLSSGSAPETKADEMRKDARAANDKAKELIRKADAWDKEKKQIEWARGVLKKWKERVESLTP